MDNLTSKQDIVSQYKSPDKKKKQIKRKCKSAESANKTKRIIKEKFKHYDLFTFKKKSKTVENSRSENDSSQVNVIPIKNLMEFDSPDKTEILGNISCSEQDFKIDKKSMNRKVSNMLKDTLIMNSSQNSDFEMSQI
ncbi:unnamed protein product [Chironomus riparius]|uniref:Uncharacterized protein n=1 Tax=Chironomus riparius TaxID=315576 RepID=A0A9N9RZH1_9DIPT|nr:unnamed protein product [Chironomus riparius]